jgi:single-strand DNA-binding protein
MAGTINKVILIGHLGDDIKMHHFEGGGCIGNVSMATNETWKDKQTEEKKKRTDWHNLVFRNKLAELMEKYTHKGDKLYIEGKIRTREWTTESGEKKYTTEIHVFDMTFLQSKGTNTGSAVQQHESKTETVKQNDSNYTDSDLPF